MSSWGGGCAVLWHRGLVSLRPRRAGRPQDPPPDDGWFGARDGDTAGLGDWWPHPERFPEGLGRLIDKVRALDSSRAYVLTGE
ncbi:alpha-galactosidase [Nonomuraea muscovyensis]|uniref:alpha-galactosidase n=1 Tax=Nonomuraea muscovyensis TaxID=1124761 RepID=UPI0033F40862